MTLRTSAEFLPVDACTRLVVGRKNEFDGQVSYRVHHGESDLLAGVNNEDRADGESDSLLVNVVQILLVDHVVLEGDLPVRIGDNRELKVGLGKLVDVLDPVLVGAKVVGALKLQSAKLLVISP